MSSISYLPTQVGVVRAALGGLGKKKKQWNLEILEDEAGRTVRFENELQMQVPHEHWDAFQGMFDGEIGNDSCFTLPGSIMDSEEDEDEVLESRREEAGILIESLLSCSEVLEAQSVFLRWVSRFGVSKDLTSDRVMVPLRKAREAICSFRTGLTESCKDDRGQLEILVSKLEGSDSLRVLEDKRKFDLLAGARVQSVFEGVQMILEVRVDFDKKMKFSLMVGDSEVADKLQESLHQSVPRIGSVFFFSNPAQFRPQTGVVDLLVEAIHDLRSEEHA